MTVRIDGDSLKYLQTPFNIHLGHMFNSLPVFETYKGNFTKYIDIEKIVNDIKEIDLEERIIDSAIFLNCISELKTLLHNVKENEKLNIDFLQILEGFHTLLCEFDNISEINDDKFNNSLEEFEDILDKVNIISDSENNDEIREALIDISIGIYGILGSFGNITKFHWKEMFKDNKLFARDIILNQSILSQ
tara:strand:+ start:641 stop:1213 length:573 start_codon:yes stop_codon:yes gene_type:complete